MEYEVDFQRTYLTIIFKSYLMHLWVLSIMVVTELVHDI